MMQNNMMPRISGHSYQSVPGAKIERSVFDRSHTRKGTMAEAGYLIPIYADEVIPGDTFKMECTSFLRLATGLTPFMDNLDLDIHFWFVPNRLLWENWKRFMGEQDNPGDSTDFLVPRLSAPASGGGAAFGSLWDNMGLRPGINSLAANTLHFRAYNFIYNSAYRDENLQDSVPLPLDDGPDTYADFTLLRSGKRHDYFTSALPWPQKGAAVQIPLGQYATVVSNGETPTMIELTSPGTQRSMYMGGSSAANNIGITPGTPSAGTFPVAFGDETGLQADLSTATSATINSLRESFALQQLLERDARGGTRYTELVFSHFNVVIPDQSYRPEYLGGGTVPLKTTVIPQTSGTATGDTPQANLAAMSTASHGGIGFTKSFVEHGVILGIIRARAPYTYQQGQNKMWDRRTKYDFYWPTLANLGEQAVKNKEIYAQGTSADDGIFGYQERWADYRNKFSEITGQFRSDFPQTLDSWHLSQKFDALPTLGEDFITERPPVDRVIAVQDNDYPQFLMDFYFKLHCTRPMPTFSVPGLTRM